MPASTFSPTASAPPPGWWAKLARRPDPAGAKAAIERMLATHDVASLPHHAVSEILSAHRVRGDTARAIVYLMWSKAFHACAADLNVTDEEIDYLRGLQHLLGLSDSDVDALRIKTSRDFYRAAINESFADGEVTASEQGALDAIARAPELSETEKAEISRESLTVVMQRVFGEVIADRRISPAQRAKLDRLARQLGVDLRKAADIGPHLDKFTLVSLPKGSSISHNCKYWSQEGVATGER